MTTLVPPSSSPRLYEATRYVLSNPGKELRSRLVRATFRLCSPVGADITVTDSAATAVEWLHCYSLIHDDLPAMDNDDLRRGKPTLHKAFDEATAILVGDGLQASAFGLVAGDARLSSDQRVKLIALIADAVGFQGMVGGQALDMAAEHQQVSLETLKTIHAGKTGALFRAAVAAGAICANASSQQLTSLDNYAQNMGLAFQIMDDVLDATASSDALGKTAGKDQAAAKSTYVSCLGLEEARAQAKALYEQALTHLSVFIGDTSELETLARLMVFREH